MKNFNVDEFVKSLKKGCDSINYIQGDKATKVLVADVIKSNGYAPEEVLSFICGQTNPSGVLDDEMWKKIVEKAIKAGGPVGKNVEVLTKVLKGKFSYEKMFELAVQGCGKDADFYKNELYLNQIGWLNTANALMKTIAGEDAKVEKTEKGKKVAKGKKVEKKSSTKSSKKDPRCQSVIGVKDGVTRVWNSMKECEVELGVGHGTVSQCISGKLRTVKGWTLSKKGEEPVKKASRSFKKPVRQYGKDKDGNMVDKVWPSLTEASKGTGIPHSSICKAINGDYHSAGGYHWENVDMSVAAA